MVSARSYVIITITTLLVGLNQKDAFGILMRKEFTFTRVSVNYAEALAECGDASHLIDTRLEESYKSFKNIIKPYYTHNISLKSDEVWTPVTRADETTDNWFWYDGEIYPDGKIQKFSFDDKFTCSGLKYSSAIDEWKYRAKNCPDKAAFAMCETQTTDPCNYRMLTGILAVPMSVSRTLLTSISTLDECKNQCNKWKQANLKECWMISYNPSASECYIIDNDVIPNDDQTCSWLTYNPEWNTYKRICYELNVYDADGTLLLYPACILPTPPYVETTTRMEKTSSAADRTTTTIHGTTTPTYRTTTVDTSTTPKSTTTTSIYTTTTSITTSTEPDTTLINTKTTMDTETNQIDTTTTSITTSSRADTTLINTTTTMDTATSQIDTTTTSIATTTHTDATTFPKETFTTPINTTSTTIYTATTPKDTPTTSITTINQKDETKTQKNTFTTLIDKTTSRETTTVTDATTIIGKTTTLIDTTTTGERTTTAQRTTAPIDTTTTGERTTTAQRTTTLIDTITTEMLSEETKTPQPNTTAFPVEEKISNTDLNTTIVETTTVPIDTTEQLESGSGDMTTVDQSRPGNTSKWVGTDAVSLSTPSTRFNIKTILLDRKTTTISNTVPTSAVIHVKPTLIDTKPTSTFTIKAVVGTISTSVHSATARTGGTSSVQTWRYTPDPSNSTCKRVCRCGPNLFNYTSIAEILANLTINVKNTSSYRRLFSSATDDRPLSIGIGWSGAGVLILVLTGIFALDCQRLFQDAMLLFENVRHLFRSV